MTLVAQICPHNHPILIGDVLISGLSETSDLAVPTIGKIDDIYPDGSGYIPTTLTRKLFIYRNIAIGWSDNKIAAKYFVKSLIDSFQDKDIQWEEFGHFLESISHDFRSQTNVTIAGYLLGDDGAKPFGINKSSELIHGYGNCRILGSGAEYFKETILKEPPPSNSNLNATSNAFTFATNVANTLLSKEILIKENFLHFFGGGYEIIIKSGSEWLQIGKILNILWLGRISAGKLGVTPHFMTYYDYVDNYLDITTIRLFSESNACSEYEENRYLVPPIYHGPTRPEPIKLEEVTNHSLVNNHLVLVNEDNKILGAIAQFNNFVNEDRSIVQLRRNKNAINMNFDKNMLRKFLSFAVQQYGLPIKSGDLD